MQSRVIRLIENVCLDNNVSMTLGSRLREDLALDSMRLAMLVYTIEKEEGVIIDLRLLRTVETVGDLVELVRGAKEQRNEA